MVSVPKDFLQSRVGDQISENWLAHGLHIFVGISSLHVFVASERAIIVSVDGPKGEASDDDSLHLFGDIVCFELNLLDLGWELDKTVSKAEESFEANSSLKLFSISDDDQPLVRFSFNESILHEQSEASSCHKESADSPDEAGGTEEDGGEKAACETVDGKELVWQIQL